MQEKWTYWIPIKDLYFNYLLDSLIDSDVLKIAVNEINNRHSLLITFKYSSGAYQITNDNGHFQKTQNNNKNADWAFFKINNSNFLKFLSEYSDTISDTIPFMHFVILTQGYQLDILSPQEPEIKIIQRKLNAK